MQTSPEKSARIYPRGEEMLSEKIRDLRKKSGLSQEELAEKLDVSRQAVSKWELGAAVPTADKLLELSDFFGVSLDYLMRFDSDNSENPVSEATDSEKPRANSSKAFRKSAMIFLFALALLAVVILVLLCFLLGGDDVHTSFQITLDGVGILVTAAIICAVLGIILLISLKK